MTTEGPIVFLCHTKEHAEKASALYDDLLAAGARPWLDARSMALGDHWRHAIPKAIQEADVFVPLLHTAFDRRGYVQEEVHCALETLRRLPPGRGFVVPFLLEPWIQLPDCKDHVWSYDFVMTRTSNPAIG